MRSATGHGVLLALPLLIVAGLWIAARLERRTGPTFLQRNGKVIATYLLIAVAFWIALLIVLPLLSMVELSFRPKLPMTQMGGPRDIYTLANYRFFLFGDGLDASGWNVLHLRAFAITIVGSLGVMLIDLLLCYPLAYVLAQMARPPQVRLLLLLLIVPYWLNEVLRAFGLRVLLSSSGLLNRLLFGAGLIAHPVDFIGLDIAMYVGLACAYMLLMILPLSNAIGSLEHSQIEAARDLGAPWWRIHANVVIPHAKPGIAAGCTLVFMLNAGALATPQILGGPRSLWFTPVVYDRFYEAFNWPQGAAYAFILLLACFGFVLLMLRLFRLSLGQVVR